MQIAKKERVDLESLSGTIERITFHSEESAFAVLRVKVSKKRELLTVTGSVPFVAVGEYIYAKGIWCNDSKHGLQFKAEFLKAIRPIIKHNSHKPKKRLLGLLLYRLTVLTFPAVYLKRLDIKTSERFNAIKQ